MSNEPTEQEMMDTWLHHYIMPAIGDGVAITLRGIEKYGTVEAMMDDGTDYDEWVSEACDKAVSDLFTELKKKGFVALNERPSKASSKRSETAK